MRRLIVTYERVSSDKQEIARQAVQRERARAAYASAEHCVIQDDGVSAYKIPIFERRGGAELCALIEAGDVDAIFVDEQSRLSRGRQSEWWNFADLCLANRTRIFIDGQELDLSDEADEIRSSIDAIMARRESKKLSHRTISGQERVAREGRWPWGKVYGYRNADGHLIVDSTEAAVVRRVFAEYVAGKGQNRIASGLNNSGLRTRNGKLFSPRQVINMLQARVYLGEVGRKGEPAISVGAHDPIIDVETFDRAVRLRASRKASPSGGRGRPAKRHLLDGLL